MTDTVTKIRCIEIDNEMSVEWWYQNEQWTIFKIYFLMQCSFTWTIYIFIVLFRKPPSYLCDVFAVLVLMPQFIKRPISFFLFSVEYRSSVSCLRTENLKICIFRSLTIFQEKRKIIWYKNAAAAYFVIFKSLYSNVMLLPST